MARLGELVGESVNSRMDTMRKAKIETKVEPKVEAKVEEIYPKQEERKQMTEQSLLSECFYYINSFKRHRVLENVRRQEGNAPKANYHKLKQYELIDSLELAMRAVQKDRRNISEQIDDEEKEVGVEQ